MFIENKYDKICHRENALITQCTTYEVSQSNGVGCINANVKKSNMAVNFSI